jgi:hypothetical protein
MANTIRIKRRATGAAGAPASLKNAELAFNEVDNVLYYGFGTAGNGDANTVIAIGGDGGFLTLSGIQTVTGNKTFSGLVTLGSNATATTKTALNNSNAVATTAYVDTAGALKADLASPTFTGTVTIPSGASISGFALLASPTFSGTPTLPTGTIATTQTANNNTTAVATTAYVDGAVAGITISSETIQDVVGGQLVTNGSHTGISAAYDDAGDGAIDLSLTTTGVSAGSHGNASHTSSFTVDTYGRLTAASNTAISIASTAVSDFNEAAQDAAAALFTNGTHSGIGATYDDANAKLNLDVADFTITLGGDLTGSATITNLGSATLTATVAANSVALGTDTTGNYVSSLVAGTGISLTNNTGEGATPTVTNSGVTGLTGTANEIEVSASTGSVTVGLPDSVNITTDLAVGGNTTITGNLTVNGTTTTVNSTTVTVDDKNLELGSTVTPTDASADGGGITLKGTTDKTLNWVDATDAWTSSEHFNIATGKAYYINGTSVLNGTTLGTGITASSLTSVGIIGTGVWQGSVIGLGYGGTNATDAAGARTSLGLVIGTNVQAYDAELAALAGLTSTADALPYFTGSGTASVTTLTSFMRTLLDDADASTARTTLGLGTISTQNSNNVSITGGSISGITLDTTTVDGGTF